jgi:hypothetical protein
VTQGVRQHCRYLSDAVVVNTGGPDLEDDRLSTGDRPDFSPRRGLNVDETTLPDPLLSKHRRRLALLGCIVFLLLAGVLLAVRMVLGPSERELQAALAEADRLDPGWRREELEARRQDVPDEENSALLVISIGPALLVGLHNDPFYNDRSKIPPPVQLDAQSTAALRAALAQYNDKLMQARRLANLPTGRFPASGFGGQPSPNIQDLIRLLGSDAVLRAQDGDTDGALESLRATLNASRSVGDVPDMASQHIRIWYRHLVVLSLQRTLAQGEPSEPALVAVQQLLEDEANKPLMLVALRAQRAFVHQQLKQQIAKQSAVGEVSLRGALAPITGPIQVKQAHAGALRNLTEWIEIAKLPPEQQETALQQLPPLSPVLRPPYTVFPPGLPDLTVASLRNLAELRSAKVGMAVERYRRAQGHWPDTLVDLVPTYLPQVPLDPFTGKELSYRRLDDGVVVYSVGPSGTLRGGQAFTPVGVPGADKGFRLWDADKRRQPSPVPRYPLDLPAAESTPK